VRLCRFFPYGAVIAICQIPPLFFPTLLFPDSRLFFLYSIMKHIRALYFPASLKEILRSPLVFVGLRCQIATLWLFWFLWCTSYDYPLAPSVTHFRVALPISISKGFREIPLVRVFFP